MTILGLSCFVVAFGFTALGLTFDLDKYIDRSYTSVYLFTKNLLGK